MPDVLHESGLGRMATAAANVRSPSPRVRMAARLYATGAAKSKKEAAETVGIHPAWFTLLTNHNEETKRLVDAVDQQIEDQTVQMSTVLRSVGREAIKRIRELMRTSARDDIALKAAQDLADRNQETSKIQRHELTAVHIGPEEAKELAAALVEGARVRERYINDVQGDFVRVAEDGNVREIAAPARSSTEPSAATVEAKAEVSDQATQGAQKAQGS